MTLKRSLEIHVDKGMEDGQKITFMGEADQVCYHLHLYYIWEC